MTPLPLAQRLLASNEFRAKKRVATERKGLTTFIVSAIVTTVIVEARMSPREHPNIGRAEMDILRYVTDHHPVTVRQVADHVSQTKGHVRTTVLNVMERLRQKGYLVRQKTRGVFHYSPRLPREELLRTLVRDFVARALGGSLSPFVAYLVQEAKLGPEEVSELRTLVQNLDAPSEEEKK